MLNKQNKWFVNHKIANYYLIIYLIIY